MGPIPGGWVDRRVDYISQVCLGAAHVVAGPDFGPLLDCESKGRVQLAVGVVRKTTGGGESKGAPSHPLSTCVITPAHSSFVNGMWRFARGRKSSSQSTRMRSDVIGIGPWGPWSERQLRVAVFRCAGIRRHTVRAGRYRHIRRSCAAGQSMRRGVFADSV